MKTIIIILRNMKEKRKRKIMSIERAIVLT
jgi:hypothetical protein